MEENFTYSSLSPSFVGAPVAVSMLKISISRQSEPPLQISSSPKPLATPAHVHEVGSPIAASSTSMEPCHSTCQAGEGMKATQGLQHPPACAVCQKASILTESIVTQCHSAIRAPLVGVQELLGLRIKAMLAVQHALRLQPCVMRVVVPATSLAPSQCLYKWIAIHVCLASHGY